MKLIFHKELEFPLYLKIKKSCKRCFFNENNIWLHC